MYLIRKTNMTTQAFDLPLTSTSWLRWLRDTPGVEVYRVRDGRFELLYVEDERPEGGSGKATLPVAKWRELKVEY